MFGPRKRAQAKFTIDANGKAHVETTVVSGDEQPSASARKRHTIQPVMSHGQWNSSDDDGDSSTDEEPIIIPSRNASFALPDPIKPSGTHPFHSSRRSVSERSTVSQAGLLGRSVDIEDDGEESEAETVMKHDTTPTGKSGDAASELRKLRDSRQRQSSAFKPKHFVSGGTAGFVGVHSGLNIISPSSMTDTSLPTPSTDTRTAEPGVRCICNRQEAAGGGDGFMLQW
jgi:hypothetical protein